MTRRRTTRIVDLYMCSTDFDYELGNAAGGVEVYSSVSDLVESRSCVSCPDEDRPCGIYRVEVRLVRVVKESSF